MHTTRFDGTISHGTARLTDLIPSFVETLSDLLEDATFRPGADKPAEVRRMGRALDAISAIERAIEDADTSGYFDTEDAMWDLEFLFDSLCEYAPAGFYFGSHPGDGSDYGFWPVDMLDM